MMGAYDLREHTRDSHAAESAARQGELEETEIDLLNQRRRSQLSSFLAARAAKQPVGTTPAMIAAEVENADGGLTAAAAAGSMAKCQQILADKPDAHRTWGPDGQAPLCAAAARGHADVVKLLLGARADPALPSRAWPQPRALHAAALQEHGKICMALLTARADPVACDSHGVTPVDYASCSEAVWPHFAALGCARASKEELIAKGVIRKASAALEKELLLGPLGSDLGHGGGAAVAPPVASEVDVPAVPGLVKEFSRPGSAYVVTKRLPPRPGSAVVPQAAATAASLDLGPAGFGLEDLSVGRLTPSGPKSVARTPRGPAGSQTPRGGSGTPGGARTPRVPSRPIDILGGEAKPKRTEGRGALSSLGI